MPRLGVLGTLAEPYLLWSVCLSVRLCPSLCGWCLCAFFSLVECGDFARPGRARPWEALQGLAAMQVPMVAVGQ